MWVWIASFILLFGLAEAYQWLKHLSLPMPIFLLGGIFLAVISNQSKRLPFGLNFDALQADSSDTSEPFIDVTPQANRSAEQVMANRPYRTSPELPNLEITEVSPSNPRSISFEIKKPEIKKMGEQ